MKRLLLPLLAALALPTAVNANFFSGDIVEKTDIGEKYIVKKSTVYETKSWKNKLAIQEDIEASKEMIEYYKKSTAKQIDLITSMKEQTDIEAMKKTYQDTIDMYENRLKRKIDEFTKNINSQKQKLEVLNEYIDKNQNNLLMFSFTPIYVDLNGNKRIQESMKVACVSPFINEEKRKELKEKSGEYLVDSGDYDLSSKVCKQYAKFKK